MTSLQTSLVIVGHVALDNFGVRSGQSGRAACVTNEFAGAFDHSVAFAGLTCHDLSGRGHFEPLFGARLSLHFGHFDLLF